ncbi:sensor histidine kinase [Streptomyces justiciae]|uniref:histidine kinase n=1 Tax=Streptomyces justiciae TaxID=2780140 RepID=A0ABU3LZB5_9ACTN|nr:HAMP domain-containing sensor histidine kinase [Streptomyces justiciae]MDT7844498.1 HAMP domain-containing sensor histidine kinase [Streptomyces justiciae]
MTGPGFRAVRSYVNGLGLRWKIAALLATGCALVAVAIGLLVHHARLEQVSAGARTEALAQLVRVRQVYELTGQVSQDGIDARLDAHDVPRPLERAATAGKRTTYLDLSSARPSVWAARPIGGHVLSVHKPLGEEAAEMGAFDRHLLVSGVVVVALAALGGAALSSRLSRELRTAAATARRISAGDLDARIGRPGMSHTKNEVAELAAAVDTMAVSLQQRLEAERRFTADVAHELRTPLTGLHTAAELLPPGRPAELVRDRVGALRTLTEDLLEIARLDAAVEEPELEVRAVGPMVAGFVQQASVGVEFSGGHDGTLVRTDARRLERIVTNLVTNAVRHGEAPVEVRVEGAVVTVRDHGGGFPEALLREGPRRFLTGAVERGQGTGLGLTIVMGQAQVIGATVSLSNAEEGGAVATVVLPEVR